MLIFYLEFRGKEAWMLSLVVMLFFVEILTLVIDCVNTESLFTYMMRWVSFNLERFVSVNLEFTNF